jgi:hypothetical protein
MVTAKLLEHGSYLIRVELNHRTGGLAESKATSLVGATKEINMSNLLEG